MNRPGQSSSSSDQSQPSTIFLPLGEGSSQKRQQRQQQQPPIPPPPPPNPAQPSSQVPDTSNIQLFIRQQPLLCKVTIPRDKGGLYERKTINPPPIVQMVIEDNDETQMWLAERYFFMVSSLYEPHVDSFVQTATENPTVGSNVSSIQKVLENNREIGLFVFGDISVKFEGQFRLRFDLFEYIVCDSSPGALCSAVSRCLMCYPGSLPSTQFSRLISDQGIRLRLRKEPNRGKRKFPETVIPGYQASIAQAYTGQDPSSSSSTQPHPPPFQISGGYPGASRLSDVHHESYRFPSYQTQSPQQRQPYPVLPPPTGSSSGSLGQSQSSGYFPAYSEQPESRQPPGEHSTQTTPTQQAHTHRRDDRLQHKSPYQQRSSVSDPSSISTGAEATSSQYFPGQQYGQQLQPYGDIVSQTHEYQNLPPPRRTHQRRPHSISISPMREPAQLGTYPDLRQSVENPYQQQLPPPPQPSAYASSQDLYSQQRQQVPIQTHQKQVEGLATSMEVSPITSPQSTQPGFATSGIARRQSITSGVGLQRRRSQHSAARAHPYEYPAIVRPGTPLVSPRHGRRLSIAVTQQEIGSLLSSEGFSGRMSGRPGVFPQPMDHRYPQIPPQQQNRPGEPGTVVSQSASPGKLPQISQSLSSKGTTPDSSRPFLPITPTRRTRPHSMLDFSRTERPLSQYSEQESGLRQPWYDPIFSRDSGVRLPPIQVPSQQQGPSGRSSGIGNISTSDPQSQQNPKPVLPSIQHFNIPSLGPAPTFSQETQLPPFQPTSQSKSQQQSPFYSSSHSPSQSPIASSSGASQVPPTGQRSQTEYQFPYLSSPSIGQQHQQEQKVPSSLSPSSSVPQRTSSPSSRFIFRSVTQVQQRFPPAISGSVPLQIQEDQEMSRQDEDQSMSSLQDDHSTLTINPSQTETQVEVNPNTSSSDPNEEDDEDVVRSYRRPRRRMLRSETATSHNERSSSGGSDSNNDISQQSISQRLLRRRTRASHSDTSESDI